METQRKIHVKEIKLFIRGVFAVIFLVLGFNFSRSAFFEEYPLFGIDYLAEVLLSLVFASFGFFTFPKLILISKGWVEGLVNKTVTSIVTDFWDQQSRKMNQAKREKQKKKEEQSREEFLNGVLVDTSVLIDGRLLDIVKTGFFEKTLVISKSVIKELQRVSDSKDKLKRRRGRRGLDVLKDLRKYSKVLITETKTKEEDVDNSLVEFAKQHNLKLLTLDFNLSKVAEVAKVKVLNINLLVEALKTVFLPGEAIEVEIVDKGKERSQGIGYLEDGTMLVVENSKDLVGTKVKVRVSKVIQSPAGKMYFCDLIK